MVLLAKFEKVPVIDWIMKQKVDDPIIVQQGT